MVTYLYTSNVTIYVTAIILIYKEIQSKSYMVTLVTPIF